MRRLIYSLLIWWFAVVSASGETIILEYRTETNCRLMHATYSRVTTVKVTDCRFLSRIQDK